jgi:uncharacterized protein with gpF-like domain
MTIVIRVLKEGLPEYMWDAVKDIRMRLNGDDSIDLKESPSIRVSSNDTFFMFTLRGTRCILRDSHIPISCKH